MIAIIDGMEYKCKTAETEKERRRGLQGVQKLPSNSGMIFFHPEKKRHGYWMYNTHIPLTILFINDDLEVVDVKQRKDVGSLQKTKPDKPVRIIIEIPYNKSMNKIIGDKVELIKNG